jgi:hypothetical protein
VGFEVPLKKPIAVLNSDAFEGCLPFVCDETEQIDFDIRKGPDLDTK